MTQSIEDWFHLIEAVTMKTSYLSREPVRDRIEFSIACEAFLTHVDAFDQTKTTDPNGFALWMSWIIKRRLIDWHRANHGRKDRAVKTNVWAPWEDKYDEEGKVSPYERLHSLCELVNKLPEKQKEAVLYWVRERKAPTGCGWYYWKKAHESLKKAIEHECGTGLLQVTGGDMS